MATAMSASATEIKTKLSSERVPTFRNLSTDESRTSAGGKTAGGRSEREPSNDVNESFDPRIYVNIPLFHGRAPLRGLTKKFYFWSNTFFVFFGWFREARIESSALSNAFHINGLLPINEVALISSQEGLV